MEKERGYQPPELEKSAEFEQAEINTLANLKAEALCAQDIKIAQEVAADLERQQQENYAVRLAIILNNQELFEKGTDISIEQIPDEEQGPLTAEEEYESFKDYPEILHRALEKMHERGKVKSEGMLAAILGETERAREIMQEFLQKDQLETAADITILLAEKDPELAKSIMAECKEQNLHYQTGLIAASLGDEENTRAMLDLLLPKEENEYIDIAKRAAKHNPVLAKEAAQKFIEDENWVNAGEIASVLAEKDPQFVRNIFEHCLQEENMWSISLLAESLAKQTPELSRKAMQMMEERGDLSGTFSIALALNELGKAREIFQRMKTEATSPLDYLNELGGLLQKSTQNIQEQKEINKEISSAQKKNLLQKAFASKDEAAIKILGATIAPQERAELLAELSLTPEQNALLDLGLIQYRPADEIPEHDALRNKYEQSLKAMIQEIKTDSAPSPEEEKGFEIINNIFHYLPGEEPRQTLASLSRNLMKRAVNHPYLRRMSKNLLSLDPQEGKRLGKEILLNRQTSLETFQSIVYNLQDRKLFPASINSFLNENELPFLRRLLAEYPNQFATTLDTLAQIENFSPRENATLIFAALNDLNAITPIIFERYRQADPQERPKLIKSLNKAKAVFFRNVSLEETLPGEDNALVAEMVYLAYKPIGMSFEQVKEIIDELDDQTKDLKDYQFPEEGYDFTIESSKKFALKKNQSLDFRKIAAYRDLFKPPERILEDQAQKTQEITNLLVRLAKGTGTLPPEEIQVLLSLISEDQAIQEFLQRYQEISDENVYHYLNEVKENLTIYFKDIFALRLEEFLTENPAIAERLAQLLETPKRIRTLQNNFGKKSPDLTAIDWGNLTQRTEMANLFARYLSSKILKNYRTEVSQNINKFIESSEGETVEMTRENLKAYISKNVGSFFAKASAGICTAEDLTLFGRAEHFHLNIVENEETVRGNNQAYIIEDQGDKKSLLLRGFNPNIDFLDEIDAESYCEKVIAIAREFKKKNNLHKIYITEQGPWHALSNRPRVVNYLRKYLTPERRKNFPYAVTSDRTIQYIYEV